MKTNVFWTWIASTSILILLAPATSILAQSTYTWDGASGTTGNWSDAANWSTSGGSVVPSGNIQGYANFDGSTRLNNTNDFSAGSGGFQIYFKNTAGAFNLYGNAINFYDFSGTDPNIQNEGTANTQTINFPITNANTHVSGSVRILNINANASPAQGPITFNGPVSAPGDGLARVINVSGGGAIAFNGAISDGSTAGSTLALTQLGSGTTTLAGANTYSGATTINAGKISINANNNLGANAASVTLNGGTLKTLNTTALTDTHAITIGASGGTINIAGTAGSGQNSRVVLATANTLLGSGALTVSGNGALSPDGGAGALVLNAANTYSGNLTLKDGGFIEYANNSSLGSSATITLGDNGGLSAVTGITVPNAITVSGTNSVLSFNNNNSGVFSGAITLNTNVTVGLRDWYNYSAVRNGTISGLISGTGGLAVNSGTGAGGVLTIANNANSYSGGTSNTSATILDNVGGSGGPTGTITPFGSGTVTVNSGGKLQLGNNPGSHNNSVFYVMNAMTLNGGTIFVEDANQHLTGNVNVTAASTLGSTFNAGNSTEGSKGLFLDGVVSGSGNLRLQQSAINTGNTYDTSFVCFSNNASTYSGTISVIPMSGIAGGSYVGINAGNSLANATVNITNNTSTAQNFGTSPIVFLTNIVSATLNALNGPGNVVLTGYNEFSHTYGTDTIALTVGYNNSSSTYSGIMSGAGSLIKVGTGTMTNSGANTYTGATTISGGALQLGDANAAHNSTVSIGVNNGLTFSSGIGSFNLGGLSGSFNETLLDTAGSAVTLNVGSNNASTTYSGVLSGAGALTKSGTGTLILSGPNTYTGVTALNGGKANAAVAENAGTSGPFGASAAANPGSITFGGGALQYSPANQNDYSGRFSTAGAQPISIDVNGQTVSYGTAIQGSGTSLTLADTSGGGRLTLTGNNSYTGNTTVSAGTLILSGDNTSATGATTVSGTLQLQNDNALAGSALTLNSGGTLSLQADADTTFAPPSLSAFSPGSTYNFQINSLNSPAGNGHTLTLTGQGGASASGTTAINISSTTSDTMKFNTAAAYAIGGNSGSAWGGDTTAFNLTGANLILNGLIQQNNNDCIISLSSSSGNTLTINGTVTANNNRTIGATVNSGVLTLNNTVSANTGQPNWGFFVNLNGGTLNLNNAGAIANNHSPGFTITGGTLDNTSGAALTEARNPIVGFNGDFTFAGTYSLNLGTGNVILNASHQITVMANTLTIGGVISGSGYGLTKAGNGTLTLSGVNTYTGNTIVSGGTMLVNGSLATGSAVTVQNSATLGGSGTINDTLTVNSGGTLSPGASIGTLTLSTSPTLNGVTFMEINTTNSQKADKLVLTSGTLTYGGALTVTNTGNPLVGGEIFTNFSAGSYAGLFSATNLPSLSAGLNWWLGNLANDGTIVVNRAPTAQNKTYTRGKGMSLKIAKSDLISDATDPDSALGDFVSYDSLTSTGSQGATITEDATYVYYSPANNNNDTLQYRVKDSRGGTATANIQINVISTEGDAQTISVSGGAATVNFAGIPGYSYLVQRSTNLADWVTLITTNAPSNGLFSLTDNFSDLGGPPSQAYYRTAQP